MEPQTSRQTDDRNDPFPLDGAGLPSEPGRKEAAPNGKNFGPTPRNLDLILDIPVTLAVELGRTRMVIEEILQLGQGSVLELDKLAGEPLDILVQGRPIGKGEVVVVNEKLGIRLTDIISPAERIQKLG
jgi:flagellar motor switch protein FliN/FliY